MIGERPAGVPLVVRWGTRWNNVALELAARPGRWRVVLCDVDDGAASYPYRRLKTLGCEVKWRQQHGRVTLTARWPRAQDAR